MRGRLLSLYAFASSFIFSLCLFVEFAFLIKGLDFFELRLVKGITGNSVFFGFNKNYDVFVYYSAILIIPALSVLFWFFFFHYPAQRLSEGQPEKGIFTGKLMALPLTLWFFAIPEIGFYRIALYARIAVFFAALASALFICSREHLLYDKRSGWALFSLAVIPSIAISFFSSSNASLPVITLSIALLIGVFWLFQFSEERIRNFRKWAGIMFFSSLVLLFLGSLLSEKGKTVLLPVFIFMAVPMAYYIFCGFGKKIKIAPFTLSALRHHAVLLFYAFTLGTFFFDKKVFTIPFTFFFWAFLLGMIKMAQKLKPAQVQDMTRAMIFSFSPIVLLHLKAPLLITLYGRFAEGSQFVFMTAFLSFVIAFSALTFLVLERTEASQRESCYKLILYLSFVILIYSSFFNPDINGEFDYFHEAENLATADLFMKGNYGLNDLYFVEHGIIQDLGIGVAAMKIFGGTLEGLRTFLMYIEPLTAISIFILCFSLFKRKYIGTIVFICTIALMLTYPVKASPYPVLHKNFLRLFAPGISLALFSIFTRTGKTAFLIFCSLFSFVSILWSIDTGIFLVISLAFSVLLLDLKKNGLRLKDYRAFPIYLGTLLILFLALFLLEKDLITAYADVIARQSTVVQVNAHALLFPAFSSYNAKTIYVAFVNPAIIVFSLATLLWIILKKDWEERDWIFLPLSLFSAALFIRAVHRSNISHLIYVSSFVPIVLALTVERLTELCSKRDAGRHLPVIIAAYTLFMIFPYNAQKKVFFFLFTQKKIPYERPVQFLSTKKIGNITIGNYQADSINALTDFFAKEVKGKAVFDFTNNYGISLWLLGAEPITKSLFIAHENTVDEQESVIRKLKEKRPEFVLFNSNDFFSNFDGINNSVRHPVIARYVLRNYRPYARVLNYHILARNDFTGEAQKKERILNLKSTNGTVDGGFKGIEIIFPSELNRHRNRYISLLMKVERPEGEREDPPYETEGIKLKNATRVATLHFTSTVLPDLLTPYQFKLKNSDEFVRYFIPLPDGNISRLVFVPANFPCRFKIGEFEIFSASMSQYRETLRNWDMFEKEELGYIPYFLGKIGEKTGEQALEYEFNNANSAEINGLNIETRKISSIALEFSGKTGKAAVFWDSGHGYFKDQAVYFSIKGNGLNKYIIDLTSVPSWYYSEHVRRLKIVHVNEKLAPVSNEFALKRLILTPSPPSS